MQFIEKYVTPGPDDQVVVIDGRVLPLPCLVEDDDGIRLLLLSDPGTPTFEVPQRVWAQAHASGAAALVVVSNDQYVWMLAETFIEHRGEHHQTGAFVAPESWNGPESRMLGYREMVEALSVARDVEEGAPEGTFVHLHCHSEFSPLDGLSKVKEIVATAVADGQTAVAVTDHGVCASHPDLQKACDEALTDHGVGIKPIFGIEANFTDDRFRRPDPEVPGDAAKVRGDYRHLTLWAMDDDGLRNLWAMSTEANRDGFYGRPRMDWDTLAKHAEGVMVGTACLRGPITQPLLEGDEALARANLARLIDIFGDRVYVEIHTNQLPVQVEVNHRLVALAREFGVPIVASVDSHYPTKADAPTHKVWIAAQTNKDLNDESDLFAGNQEYHLLTEAEVRAALAYLGADVVQEAVANTVLVARRCTARLSGETTTPIFSKRGGAQRDVERLVDICMANWGKTVGKTHSQEDYFARFEREMRLLIDKGFCGYMLMVADYCAASKQGKVGGRPLIVGPGRGSGGGSLVGYLSEITDLDPVESDLLFERFLTEGRVSLPDFDVDFPTSSRDDLMTYVIGRYGEEYVMRVGTHTRLKSKGVIRDLARVLKSTIDIHYPDIDAICKIIEEAEADTAGLGLSWEELMAKAGDSLEAYQAKYPMIFDLAEKMVGRLKTYGKHAAGVVIATDSPLTGRIPMRHADGGLMVAEFDLNALEGLGLVKFDFLTLRTLDTIQEVLDSIRATFGTAPDVYSWREEYLDPEVWEDMCEGHTLGIFQIETRSGTRLTRRFKPRNLHELADVLTLVRPGPMRSGLTETYLRRKEGLEEVSYPDPRLESVLSRTYGTLLYQEDIMATCMVLAGYDSNEADEVRKILGKKKIEKIASAGVKFVNAAVERGMTQEAADNLWAQMAEFAKYSFNRAHAYGYAVLAYWTAWFKVHYPAQFLSAVLTTVDKDRIPEFVNEARRQGYKVLPPDINLSGHGFSIDGINIRYGLDQVKGVGEAAMLKVIATQPYTSVDDFLERSKVDSGTTKTLAAVGAFDSLEPDRKALERRLAFQTTGECDRCVFKDERVLGPGGLPCTFDWANEKDPPLTAVGRGKDRQMLPKPPPKRCTKACRNFTAPVLDLTNLGQYTDADIRAKERDLLGIYLSSTPFDVIPQDILDEEVVTGEEAEAGPNGDYVVVATVSRVRKHITKTGKEMAFATLYAQTSDIDVTVFTDQWLRYGPDLTPDRLCFAYLSKNDRGFSLVEYQPL